MYKTAHHQRYQDRSTASQRKTTKSAVKEASIKDIQERAHGESSTDGCRNTGKTWSGFVHLQSIPSCRQNTGNGLKAGKARSPVWGTEFMTEGPEAKS